MVYLTQILANDTQYIVFLPCLTEIPANHKQQIVFATSHADTSKSKVTNLASCLISRRYQQIVINRWYFLQCVPQISANHKQQFARLVMSHADTSKSQTTKSYFLPCLTQIPANHKKQKVLYAMFHADTSKLQATNRTSCHVSRRYQQITGNKSYFLPCVTQIPANHRQQIARLAMSDTDTNNKSQATNRITMQQIVLLAMSHADTSKSQERKSYFLLCLTQISANHRQQIVLLAISDADTSK